MMKLRHRRDFVGTGLNMPIIVDENEPLIDVEDPPFEPRHVTVRKDKWVTDEFEILDFLGRGKFGEVKRCKEKSSELEFAAKFICAPGKQEKQDVEQEVEVMKKLQHKRLLQLYDAFQTKEQTCLVLEIILGGELFDRVIDDDFILTERACIIFMRQICEGVAYMHSKQIIHLDMKPENILCLTKTGNRIKIIDFGLAREYDPKKELRVLFGTPEFMAPEVVQYENIDLATDMWSVGVICYVLLSGLSPFMGDNDNETLSNVIRGKFSFDFPEFKEISDEAKDLMAKLLVKDQNKRLTAGECLKHIWLRKREKSRTPSLNMSKKRLKTFVYRRKWQKIVNAIIALKRMGVAPRALRRRSVMAQLHHQESIFGWPLEKIEPEGKTNQTEIQINGQASSPDQLPSLNDGAKTSNNRAGVGKGYSYSRDSSHHTNSTDSGVDFSTDSPEENGTTNSTERQKDLSTRFDETPGSSSNGSLFNTFPRRKGGGANNKASGSKVGHFLQKFSNPKSKDVQQKSSHGKPLPSSPLTDNASKCSEKKDGSRQPQIQRTSGVKLPKDGTSNTKVEQSGEKSGNPKFVSATSFAKSNLFKPKTTTPKQKINIYR